MRVLQWRVNIFTCLINDTRPDKVLIWTFHFSVLLCHKASYSFNHLYLRDKYKTF